MPKKSPVRNRGDEMSARGIPTGNFSITARRIKKNFTFDFRKRADCRSYFPKPLTNFSIILLDCGNKWEIMGKSGNLIRNGI
jgi:hypothetical protein